MTRADKGNMAVARREFRVVWQREGLSKRTARFRSLPLALRKSLILQGRIHEVTDVDPDDYACCSGECGCRGLTNAQAWAERAEQVPPLVYGPVIESREFTATPWKAA